MTDYWKNRFIKSSKDIFDGNEEYVKEIFKIYQGTINELDRKIFNILNSMEDVNMQEAKKLLNKKEIKSFKSGISEFKRESKDYIDEDIEENLNQTSKRVRISRLQAMETLIIANVSVLLNNEKKKLFKHLSSQFETSYYKDIYDIQNIQGYESISGLPKEFIESVVNKSWLNDGDNFSDRIWKRKDKLLNALDIDLRQGLITGKSPDEITKQIADKLETSKKNAKRLVLTESAAIHSNARKAMYERMGVEKYQLVATLDLRTTEICISLDGKVFFVKDYERGVTAPPFHINCRTTTVPYYDDDLQKEIENTRMARDPETKKSVRVENLSYKDWYEKYVVEFNDKEEYKNIVSILGYKVAGNLEKYRDIKYNDNKRYEQINREVKTIQMINNKNWENKFKERLKDMYYEFRGKGYEFNMHGLERTASRIQRGKFTKEEILEVLNKDFNKRQYSDNRPVKFYNNIQIIYLDNGIEVHNIISRGKNWKVDDKLYDYNK